MGVPKFYKWLSERYPLINQLANSDIKPEFDNMYLDMNGIIHNSTHSDAADEAASKALSDEQMYTAIFKYLEKLFAIARPKKLLYMAIDGVAPRAKMNQQRQRRFRAAKDARENLEAARRRGEDVDASQVFDSNCITPGTHFMNTLSNHIRYFIRKKMKEDAAWQGVKVIFSGAEVPGEGEHKIMMYIRNMRMQPGFDPNLRHCLYGLDADLVMLSLASHQPHFALLREEVIFGAQHLPRKVMKRQDQFQFLHISLLREYLDLEFRTALLSPAAATPLPFDYNLERIVDDWVILAFFVGNDFLPHLPTLDIGEGGLDTLFTIYREELPHMGGYIFDKRSINWKRLERITRRMGELEEAVFAERQEQAVDFARKQRRKERREQAHAVLEVKEDELFDGEEASPSPDAEALMAGIAASLADVEALKRAEAEAGAAAEAAAAPKVFDSQLSMLIRGKDAPTLRDEETGEALDYEALTFKQRYYREKYPEWYDKGVALARDVSGSGNAAGPAPLSSVQQVRLLVQNYCQGLKWVAAYYYEGCRSWKWFFAYRYAPLASDIVDIEQLDLTLQLGYPFRPMEQLLGVLPPASGNKFLPPAFRALMDPRTSSVADFYPLDFSIDMNGKRSAWEGIALIPFIDETRLLKALANIPQSHLSADEQRRNARYGDEYIIEYDANASETVPATLPFMPPIVDCHSRERVWHVPTIPMTAEEAAARAAYEAETRELAKSDPTLLPVPAAYCGNFLPELCPGVRIPTEGYPSLVSSVQGNGGTVSAALQKVQVNVFGMESRKDSLVLTVAKQEAHTGVGATAALAQRFVGQRVFVDWPYLKEGLLKSLVDGTHVWTSSGARAMSQTEAATTRTECAVLQQKLLGTRAVDVGTITLMCMVHPFIGMKRAPNGAIQRSFADEAVPVPWQLVFPTLANPDPRYKELPPPALKDAYPIGTQIVHIGPQHYGALGRIVAHEAGGKTVTVAVQVGPAETAFGSAIAKASALQFYPSYLVSKSLAIHPLVLSKICSSVYLQQERTDIGLRIKFSKQAMQVPEYARRVEAWNGAGAQDQQKRNNSAAAQQAIAAAGPGQQATNEGWEYSEKAIALLAAYKRRFPLLFELMNDSPNTFKYDAELLVQPNPVETAAAAAKGPAALANPVPQKTASDAIAEIDAWLKTVGITNLLLIPCSSQLMAERGIKAVEAESARLAALRDAQPLQEVMIQNVPIFHLYRADPSVAWSPTDDLPELGDRVLSLRSDSGAPFGVRGTVVCVHQSRHVEVVFDKPFTSGTTLNHKCSNLRGQMLPLTAVLNVTKPKVLAPKGQQGQQVKEQKKAPQPQQQPQQQQPQQVQQQKAAAHNQATAPAAAAATQAAPVQILKRPAPAPAPVAAAAAPVPSPADVNAASEQLKQMLHIGHPAMPAPIPMGSAPAPAASAAAAPAAAAADGAEGGDDADPMQRLLNKGKARKGKPVTAGAPGTGMLVGPPVAPAPFPMAYPPHGMPPHGMPHGMVPQYYPPPPHMMHPMGPPPPQGYMGPPPPHFEGGPMGPLPPHMQQQQQFQGPPQQQHPQQQQQPPQQ